MSLIDEIGELQFEGLVACGATLGKSTSDHADPAQLLGQVNGLMDAEGVPVSVAGTVLAVLKASLKILRSQASPASSPFSGQHLAQQMLIIGPHPL